MKTDQIIQGDCREEMRKLPEESIHMVMFSPPYWGLRDYGEGTEAIWGGEDDCEHQWGDELPEHHPGQVEQTKWKNADAAGKGQTTSSGRFCQKCGAWRGQLGLEPDFRMYIAHTVEIFREIKRVLRPDGSVYLNIGDTYSGGGGVGGKPKDHEDMHRDDSYPSTVPARDTSLPSKCKILIPHRVAISLIDDGWILRNDIIWLKPNPMPSSVKDRLNTTTEKIFHLVKNKRYWYDLDAIREPHKENSKKRAMRGSSPENKYARGEHLPLGAHSMTMSQEREYTGYDGMNDKVKNGKTPLHPNGKNPGDVFEVSTKPFSAAHFAVYPPELCEKPIKASCPPKVCAECGTSWEREVDLIKNSKRSQEGRIKHIASKRMEKTPPPEKGWRSKRKLKGWQQQCDCDTNQTEPGIVLDPMCGAGTTCMIAKELGRRYIGIEISEEYAELSRERISKGDSYIRKQTRKQRQVEKAREENYSLTEWIGLEESD